MMKVRVLLTFRVNVAHVPIALLDLILMRGEMGADKGKPRIIQLKLCDN